MRRQVRAAIAERLRLAVADKTRVVDQLRAVTFEMAPAQQAADAFEFPTRIVL